MWSMPFFYEWLNNLHFRHTTKEKMEENKNKGILGLWKLIKEIFMDGYNDVASSEGPGVYIPFPFKVVTEVVSVQSTCLYQS